MTRSSSVVTTKRRCPKCGSGNFTVTEVWDAAVIWEVNDGAFDPEVLDKQPGMPTGEIVGDCCKCDHTWKFRGARSHSDILEDT